MRQLTPAERAAAASSHALYAIVECTLQDQVDALVWRKWIGSIVQTDALRGCYVLIVEDDATIASNLVEAFQDAGTFRVYHASSVQEALDALSQEPAPDVAILDLDLRGQRCDPVAEALMARGVPFVFSTGYGAGSLPRGYADRPFVPKPLPAESVLEEVARLIAR